MVDVAEAYVAHMTPVRLRLKAPGRLRDRSFFEAVRQEFSAWPAVQRVEVNPGAANIIVHCANAGAFLDLLKSGGPLSLVERASEKTVSTPQTHQRLTALDQHVQRLSGGRYNIARVSVFLVVGASVAFKLARGNNVSAAVLLLWYAGGAVHRWWDSRNNRLVPADIPSATI